VQNLPDNITQCYLPPVASSTVIGFINQSIIALKGNTYDTYKLQ